MYALAHAIDKIGILYVDDEEQSLKYFTESFEDIAPIYTANSAAKGLEIFHKHQGEIGIVLSDKKMPGVSGIEFLEKIRKLDDQPLRILVTAYSDLNLAVEALNEGLLYSYLTKPWDPADLEVRLKRTLDRFWITRERDKLLRERAVAFQEMLMAEKAASIGILSNGLNHHMRNSLMVIQSFFDMIPMQLQEELNGKPRDHFFWTEYYEKVEGQIGRMTSILSNLSEGTGGKDLQNPVLHTRDDIDLTELIENAARKSLGSEPTINFSVRSIDDVPVITADFEQVSQMAFNILSETAFNAGPDGTIEVKLSSTQMESSGAAAVRIQFIDDGTPVPEMERARLFDPFLVRSDRPGELGANLAGSYLTVFQHGGKIQAAGIEDDRNMIEVILPLSPVAPSGGEIFTRLIEETIQKSNSTAAS